MEAPKEMSSWDGIKRTRFVIGIDYGTTFTGVAYATPDSGYISLHEIDLIQQWGAKMENEPKVPSVISYSRFPGQRERQWGADLSEGAIAMVNTKMELQPQSVRSELELIVHALDGMYNLDFERLKSIGSLPPYTTLSAQEIVTDYLGKIFKYLETETERIAEFKDVLPTDVVITIPTDWSYTAKNSTFRAMMEAGINNFPRLEEIIFTTEAEAAATYTARYLKDELGSEFLRPGQCFVLCDAGGGTVDLVSYKVKQVTPSLELERIGIPTGAKCGSTQIDRAFQRWIQSLIGERYYQQLAGNSSGVNGSYTVQSKPMRQLMAKFEDLKQGFHKNERDMEIDLPAPLNKLQIGNKVNGGEIIITNAIMASFFQQSVGKILELIEFQISQIADLKKRVTNIFLAGGYGASRFLQEELEFSLNLSSEGIQLRRPKTSWTAVVQGAVLCGVEKETTANLTRAASCPKHFGIVLNELYSKIKHEDAADANKHPLTKNAVAGGRLRWLVSKGDVVLSDEAHVIQQGIDIVFQESEPKARRLVVYSCDHDENRPTKIENSVDELDISQELNYNLADIPLKDTERSFSKKGRLYTASLLLTVTLSYNKISSVLTFNGNKLAEGQESWSQSYTKPPHLAFTF